MTQGAVCAYGEGNAGCVHGCFAHFIYNNGGRVAPAS